MAFLEFEIEPTDNIQVEQRVVDGWKCYKEWVAYTIKEGKRFEMSTGINDERDIAVYMAKVWFGAPEYVKAMSEQRPIRDVVLGPGVDIKEYQTSQRIVVLPHTHLWVERLEESITKGDKDV